MEYQLIDVHVDDAIGRIVLDRPDRLNALTERMLVEIDRALTELSADTSVHVIVLEAAGRGFSVGHDLQDMIDREESYFDALFGLSVAVMGTIHEIPQPVIAKVHGVAAAAGCQLVAACDLVVASEDARFGTTGLKVGLFCSTPMVPLTRAIGRKRALEMLLTGDLISAATAAEWGLVNRVVPIEDLEKATVELARQIARYAPTVVGLGKEAFYRQIEMTESDAYSHTRGVMARNAAIPDGQEGFEAFLAKRPAVWAARSDV